MRGVQDAASNYRVRGLRASALIDDLTKIGKPIVFEEELAFTQRFVEMHRACLIIRILHARRRPDGF
jgi:hypothetical protein